MTVEGVACEEDKVFGVQYHPESAPGPQDSGYLFDQFQGKTVTLHPLRFRVLTIFCFIPQSMAATWYFSSATAVDGESLANTRLKVTHLNLLDCTIEGAACDTCDTASRGILYKSSLWSPSCRDVLISVSNAFRLPRSLYNIPRDAVSQVSRKKIKHYTVADEKYHVAAIARQMPKIGYSPFNSFTNSTTVCTSAGFPGPLDKKIPSGFCLMAANTVDMGSVLSLKKLRKLCSILLW